MHNRELNFDKSGLVAGFKDEDGNAEY